MSRPFTTVLVANRGEIARRIFRTARTMGLRCVAVYVDTDAAEPFVAEADGSVHLATGYLDGAAIIDAARRTGAEAIHPGYGFLSENAGFAADVLAAGLVWVGPSPTVITAMGDKIAAKAAAVAAGVPTLPSWDDPATAPDDAYPLLVKAAAGGGGKGMRIVADRAELDGALASARREAASSFGDDRVFVERYVARSRHIEIQILGDGTGNRVHLGERECSIQRRHQKIIEESPSPAVDDEQRAEMGAAALRLADAIDYQSTGTVEFLVDAESGAFYFLEVNTRLQVEHPVTEAVTGIDLVREQLRVAAGEPLGYDQTAITVSGHAIEARLYAEDPSRGFLPAAGTLTAFAPSPEPAVRWDSGVETGSVVGVKFDPMLAKVIAHALTRTEAAGRLALALERLHLGGVTTNRDFLANTLRHPSFLAGDTTTDFIDRVAPAPTTELTDDELRRVALAGALWQQGRNRADAPVLATIPTGWRNARLPSQDVRFVVGGGGEPIEVRYQARRDGTFALDDGGSATVHRWWPGGIDVEVDGRRATSQVTAAGEQLLVQSGRGTVELEVLPRFGTAVAAPPTGALIAPMPGLVLDVRVAAGDAVTANQVLIVLEAMKMEHHVKTAVDGVVAEVHVAAGQQVDNGTLLLVVDA